jgi:hypothetical protein
MKDCEWITSQVEVERVRRRYGKRRPLRARVASLLPFGHHAARVTNGPSHRGTGGPEVGSRA